MDDLADGLVELGHGGISLSYSHDRSGTSAVQELIITLNAQADRYLRATTVKNIRRSLSLVFASGRPNLLKGGAP